MPFGRHLRSAALVAASLVAFATTAHATPSTSGPAVSLDRTVVADGERVVLTIDGFDTLHVTISVCGNEARRGSARDRARSCSPPAVPRR